MMPQNLIQDATRDGLTMAPTDKGTLRVHGPKAALAKWAPILKERKAEILVALSPSQTVTVTELGVSRFRLPEGASMSVDYLAMLKQKTGHALVGELPKLPKGAFDSKDSTRTNENAENAPSAEHYRLPDGRELWVSPPETPEQIQARHPGADAATVTEATSAEEAAAIAYCERVARDRAAGRVPGSYTATTHCRGCGTVHIFAGAPARVDACPWCLNRAKGLPIPRPEVTCADCAHFTADPVGHSGIGTCARGGPPKGQMPAYPRTRRRCPDFEAAKGKLA